VEKARKESHLEVTKYAGNQIFLDNIDKDLLFPYLEKKNLKKLKYTLQNIQLCKGHDCYYVVCTDPKNKHDKLAEIWIDTTTLAFVKLAYQRSYEAGEYAGSATPMYKALIKNLYKEYIVEYKQGANKQWYLDKVDSYLRTMNKTSKDTIHIKRQYQVTEVIKSKDVPKPKGRTLSDIDIVENEAMLWDDPAWTIELPKRKKTK
jgi:hypothetical protein